MVCDGRRNVKSVAALRKQQAGNGVEARQAEGGHQGGAGSRNHQVEEQEDEAQDERRQEGARRDVDTQQREVYVVVNRYQRHGGQGVATDPATVLYSQSDKKGL